MATIITKKSRRVVNIPAIPEITEIHGFPVVTFTTRDGARAFASNMRRRGVTPTTPTKAADGWHVKPKTTGLLKLARRK